MTFGSRIEATRIEKFEDVSFLGWKWYKIFFINYNKTHFAHTKSVHSSHRNFQQFQTYELLISISQHSEILNIKYIFTVCLDSVIRRQLLQWRQPETRFHDEYFHFSELTLCLWLPNFFDIQCHKYESCHVAHDKSNYLIAYAILNTTAICWPITISGPFI
jgi:hypothetical protein